MEIILNEREWAREMTERHELGRKPTETLRRVARYYLDTGYPRRDLFRMLERFILQCDPNGSLAKWSDSIDAAIKRAVKTPAVQIDGIPVTSGEMDIIGSIDGVQIKRLAFTLLCLSKYRDSVRLSSDHWVNTQDSSIMSIANINTSVRRQSKMYHDLRELGLIRFSRKVGNTNVRVEFATPGETSLYVTDFRNLGNQYMLAAGSHDYIRCECCGLVVRKGHIVSKETDRRGRPQKYCRPCAAEMKVRGAVNPVMRRPQDQYAALSNT